MKKIMLCALLVGATSLVFGQEKGKVRKKRFTTGFNIGVNHANALIANGTSSTINNGLGLRFGLISNFAFAKRFSIEPKAELSFNTSSLNNGVENISINPVDLEFMTHLKFNLMRSGVSPYFIAGPNVKIPVGNGTRVTVPTRQDVAIDLGIGIDLPIGRKVRVAPELRYSYGLTNITQSSTLEDIRFHNISLILNFAGRPRL